ncbi:hypothetical protein V2J09_001011 [Rumex salicifolius]
MPSKRRSSSAGKRNDSDCKKAKTDTIGAAEGNTTGSTPGDGPSEAELVLEPIPVNEAKQRWPRRYLNKKDVKGGAQNPKSLSDSDQLMQAKNHFSQAEVDGFNYKLNDCAFVQSEEGKLPYICKIVEIFEGVDGLRYFRAQWFYRPEDTTIEESYTLREKKRVFLSEVQDDNPLDCLVKKLNIIKLQPKLDVATKTANIPDCDFYYDMMYVVPYCSFLEVPTEEDCGASSGEISTISSDVDVEVAPSDETSSEMRLLDLYAGCGAMSTGLCLGANIFGVNLTTRWAIDINAPACESLKLNHPETEVRNESVEDFLALLKEWEKLCMHFSLIDGNKRHEVLEAMQNEEEEAANDDSENSESEEVDAEEFEVEKILAICYGDPNNTKKTGLYMKVHWKGYGPDEDTWEPFEGLSGCQEKIKQFVTNGFKEKFLPLPGDVDAICGGPPCQGISGFNRFRDSENPLKDPKNKQLLVYMDVVDYLRPKFVLMENVVDLVKFSRGFLGRYALGKLVDMNYQARMGMMAAGSYGLPQFRMRVFIWGARPNEKLPQYALPTHDVVNRGVVPTEFEKILVAYDDAPTVELKQKLLLADALTDLPEVSNYTEDDDVPFNASPKTEFQHLIRLKKDAPYTAAMDDMSQYTPRLFDHFPLKLNADDMERVSMIPKKKGANFRDLPGLRVRSDKKIELDPDVERVYLKNGKPLVPEYAIKFVGGSSLKPFGRLWWDETVPTVVGRAEPHNQAILHPAQDRVLTVRENARLQGFPDYYKLCGPVKERSVHSNLSSTDSLGYIQVGNAVAVPVARALGYSMAKASRREVDDEAVFVLPPNFPKPPESSSPSTSEDQL